MTITDMPYLDDNFLQGEYFHLCQDLSSSSLQPVQRCLVRLDEEGFFLHWKPENKDGQVVDCGQLREVRSGLLMKESKMFVTLDGVAKSNEEPLNERIVALCSGPDVVNVTAFNLLAKDSQTAKRWILGLTKIINDSLIHNLCVNTTARKQWTKLCLSVNRESKIPVKSIIKPFLAGMSSKGILQILGDLGLPNGKNDAFDVKQFSFDVYRSLCNAMMDQQDMKSVFQALSVGHDTVNIEKMKNWLNENQRDPQLNEILCSMFDSKAVQSIIDTHEPTKQLAAKGVSNHVLSSYMFNVSGWFQQLHEQ